MMKPIPNPFVQIISCNVCSSHGTLLICSLSGSVLSLQLFEPKDKEARELRRIMRFDVAEYLTKYSVSSLPGQLDILDLGYWFRKAGKTQYEEPAHDWRIETAELRKENNGETYMLINH